MIFFASIFLAAAPTPGWTKTDEAIEAGRRLVEAIKGRAEFQDSDFLKPLTPADKEALRQFGACKVKYLHHSGKALSNKPNVIVEDPNDVIIGLDCKGVPESTPAGISLYFKDSKVVKIETHNADLMQVDR